MCFPNSVTKKNNCRISPYAQVQRSMVAVQMHNAGGEAYSSTELWEVQARHWASIADRRIDGCNAPAAVSLYRGKPQINNRPRGLCQKGNITRGERLMWLEHHQPRSYDCSRMLQHVPLSYFAVASDIRPFHKGSAVHQAAKLSGYPGCWEERAS